MTLVSDLVNLGGEWFGNLGGERSANLALALHQILVVRHFGIMYVFLGRTENGKVRKRDWECYWRRAR